MGIQQKDPEYLRAKYAFIRDLIQFHESRSTGLKCDPKINGKEVDLYLLYQIVTSHGGWEKINLRNEWDKLLEHFHIPRSTNGGVAIKQIYLKYLELYEKIHYLGEDVDAKDEAEEEIYDQDFRGRRRYPNKLISSSHHHHHHHHSHHHHSSSSSHGHHHHHGKEVTDQNRSQLGLTSRILESSDYEGLLLSLQSPLPNEQDMAISVCTLLSNETKHVLRFSKSPAILNMLLAHAGIYQDCGMRLLMEETYRDARKMDYAEFWDEVLHHPDARQLLCECFVRRVHTSLGLTDDEGAIISQIQEIEDGDLPEEEKFAMGTALRLKLARIRESQQKPILDLTSEPESSSAVVATPAATEVDEQKESPSGSEDGKERLVEEEKKIEDDEPEPMSVDNDEGIVAGDEAATVTPAAVEEEVKEEPEVNGSIDNNNGSSEDNCLVASTSCSKINSSSNASVAVAVKNEVVELDEEAMVALEEIRLCCSSCPCQRLNNNNSIVEHCTEFSIERPSSKKGRVMVDEAEDGPINSLPVSLARSQETGDKVGQRISQIAHILRNLSFEQDNACIMAKNANLMRFLLVTANCTFGTLPQTSFDIIGNISSYIRLEEPLKDPLTSMLLTLVTSGVFSTDRFKILRSLEALRELTKVDGNENVIARYVENRVYRRMCDLLTLSDIMLLIYTLECILSMTGLGEAVCDEIVRVQGSVATLVSLVTVEAQSYGPKGCILMRVVETVTGTSTVTQQPTGATPASTPQQQSSLSAPPQQQQQVVIPVHQSMVSQQSQHLLQQHLQQPPMLGPVPTPGRATTAMARPSPATSPGLKVVSGTTTVVPPVHGQNINKSVSIPSSAAGVLQVGNNPINVNNNNSQVFGSPASSTLLNHLSSPGAVPAKQYALPQVVAASVPIPAMQKPSALPVIQTDASHHHHQVPIGNATASAPNGTTTASVGGPPAPPPGAIVIHGKAGPNATPPVVPLVPGAQPVVATVNGAGCPTLNTSLVTANLPQISNHSLNQHVVTPSISLVTSRGTLSEEAWAIAWLKGTFESSSGTSIEQGEIYRMYSAARKNPNVVLSLEQFVQCVKCAYGASVGPVIKQFGGGTSLSFFEGIKPKIAIRAVVGGPGGAAAFQAAAASFKAVAVSSVSSLPNTTVVAAITTPASSISTSSVVVVPSSTPQQISASSVVVPTAAATIPPSAVPFNNDQNNGGVVVTGQSPPPPHFIPSAPQEIVEAGSNNNNNNNSETTSPSGTGATLPVSVHIPSREPKPSLSPILQATLSLPPKAKNANSTSGSKRSKNGKDGSKKQRGGKKGAAFPSVSKTGSDGVSCSKGSTTLSPSSSAIRSLLASKVAQRQQKKLQQQLPKNSKSKLNDKLNSKEELNYSGEVVKVNGVGPDGLDKAEESSASSSILSSDGSDNSVSTKAPATPITSFHGVLQNGQANMDLKNELGLEVTDGAEDGGKNRGSMKGMLVDLLERRVPAREPVNGMMTGREIRISEKGLELIDKMDETPSDPNTTVVNHTTTTTTSSTCTPPPNNEVQDSQKMTFYSSTSDAQVTLQGQACVIPGSESTAVPQQPLNNSVGSVTLASGGGTSNNSAFIRTSGPVGGQQLGLKRPSSPPAPALNNSGEDSDDLPPPCKKQAVDSSLSGEGELDATSLTVNVPPSTTTTAAVVSSVVSSAGSVNTITPTPTPTVVQTNNSTAVVVSTASASLPPGAGAQVVQLPLRLSVNPQNPQQLTFTRQLVLPSGQQLLLSTGNSQSAIQGQVIISKPQGTSTDQMPKAIIILQQQGNSQENSQGQTAQIRSIQGTVANLLQQQTQNPQVSQQQGVPCTQNFTLVSSTVASSVPNTTTVVSTPQQQTLQGVVVSSAISLGNALAHQQTLPVVSTSPMPQSQVPIQHRPQATVIAASGVKSQTVVARLPGSNQQQIQSNSTSAVLQGQTQLVHQVVAAPLHQAGVQSGVMPLQQQHLQHSLPQHPTAVNNMIAKPAHHNLTNFEGIRSSSYPHLTSDQLDMEFPFLCEWAGCGLRFLRPQQVSMHALRVHCPESLVDAIRCEWGQNGCDPLLRKRFSLMTHLQDRHCSKQALEMALYRRKNKIEPPPVPQQPLHHPGYAPNAAFHAIKRHAMSFMNTKELTDDNEGPVTKSIRLTSALILRNLVNYSSLGRKMLQGYESHLSAIAMSNVESSRTIAQLLHDMSETPRR